MEFFKLVDNIVRVASLVCEEHIPSINDEPHTRSMDERILALRDAILDFETGVETLEWATIMVSNDRFIKTQRTIGDSPKTGDTCKTCLGGGTKSGHPDDPENCPDCGGDGDSPKTYEQHEVPQVDWSKA